MTSPVRQLRRHRVLAILTTAAVALTVGALPAAAVDAPADTTGPTLTSWDMPSEVITTPRVGDPSSADAVLRILVSATDEGSGPASVSVELVPAYDGTEPRLVSTVIDAGEPGPTRSFLLAVDLPEAPVYTNWKVDRVVLTDVAGNDTVLAAQALLDNGYDSQVEAIYEALFSEPRNVTATAGVESAVLTWDPPELTAGPVQNYTIALARYGPYISVPGDVTTVTIPDLLPGFPYSFNVSINGPFGMSAQSNAVYPLEGTGVRPTKVKVERGYRTALVSWRRPPTGSGPRIVGYVVGAWDDGIQRQEVRFDTTTTRQRLSGLFPGTEYIFTVRAIFSDGRISALGTPSAPVLISDTPGEVTRVVATPGTTPGTATLTWRRPDYIGAGPVTSYAVSVSDNKGGFYRTLRVGTSQTWTRLTGLPSGASLFFTVIAINDSGFGVPGFGGPITIR